MKRIIAFMLALLLLASLMTYNLSLDREEEEDGWHTVIIYAENAEDCPEWNCSEWECSDWSSTNDTIDIGWRICWCAYEDDP